MSRLRLAATQIAMSHSFDDVPLRPSAYGRRLYASGRRLVAEAGVRLDELVWDADEVLWDWLLQQFRLLAGSPGAVLWRNFGHREWIGIRPGVFELIWGMRHESLERGHDPHLRIWTSGYPWRMWRIAREIPGFADLIGPPAPADPEDTEWLANHPRVFTRPHWVAAAEQLLEDGVHAVLAPFPEAVRETILTQLHSKKPVDSGFKIPELAQLLGLNAFSKAQILIDDTKSNVERFVATGRRGVHIISEPPRAILGIVPNSVWGRPSRAMKRLQLPFADGIVEALEKLAHPDAPAVATAAPSGTAEIGEDYPTIQLVFDVPNRILQQEWVHPVRALKKRFAKLRKGKGPGGDE